MAASPDGGGGIRQATARAVKPRPARVPDQAARHPACSPSLTCSQTPAYIRQPGGCIFQRDWHGRHQAPGRHHGTARAGLRGPGHDRGPQQLVDPGYCRSSQSGESWSSSSSGRAGPGAVMEVAELAAGQRGGVALDAGAGRVARTRRSPSTSYAHGDETVVRFTHAGLARAGRVHGPLHHQVGVLPARAEGRARGRLGHARTPATCDQQLGLTGGPAGRGELRTGAERRVDDVFRALADPSRRPARPPERAQRARRCVSCAPGWTWPASRSASTWPSWRPPTSWPPCATAARSSTTSTPRRSTRSPIAGSTATTGRGSTRCPT